MIKYLFTERVKKNDEYFKVFAPAPDKSRKNNPYKVEHFKNEEPMGEYYLPKINRHLEFDTLKNMVGAA